MESFARILANAGLITDQQSSFRSLLYDRYGLGVILAYLWKEIPFIIYFVIALMANINGSLGEATTNLGANKLQAFMKVTLPLCMNTVLSGFLIIFVFALGAYELPFILEQRYQRRCRFWLIWNIPSLICGRDRMRWRSMES